MGVTGLWTVVQPCARPIKLETLNKKRLAVDASIWIYQFLKAVRDKQGNALRNSHVVGFFRRICKLLFFGIKPVFVFDGGAPALKRQTIIGRKQRREGRREDAVRTAGKLLALQMQRRAEEDAEKRKHERAQPPQEDEEPLPEDLVYVEELQMTPQERRQHRTFRKKDAYHLPDLDVSMENMGASNDPRIMSQEDLEEYAKQFHSDEDINLYDFSKIDFNSPFFLSLPASDRYNILNAARLRSRLRMGVSKEQLDTMFPDRMAFSRFQIDRVKERNELTQRLMNINGMNDDDAMAGMNGFGRVAGEKGREYVLVKNDGVEGGWALGVVTDKNEGKRNKPIDVDGWSKIPNDEVENNNDEMDDEDNAFEDVPIEGLNRLPKRNSLHQYLARDDMNRMDELSRQRQVLYSARKAAAEGAKTDVQNTASDDLFVARGEDLDAEGMDNLDELFESVGDDESLGNEDEQLSRAIAMSLEDTDRFDFEEKALEIPHQSKVSVAKPFSRGNGCMIAHNGNNQSNSASSKTQQVPDDDEDEDIDLRAALLAARKAAPPAPQAQKLATKVSADKSPSPQNFPPSNSLFDGPLPFEKVNLGSFLSKKQKETVHEAGGFEREQTNESKEGGKPRSKPLPPWFSGEPQVAKKDERAPLDLEFDGSNLEKRLSAPESLKVLAKHATAEVIELDGSEDDGNKRPRGDLENSSSSNTAQDHSLKTVVANSTQKLIQTSLSPQEVLDVLGPETSDEETEWSESSHEDVPSKRPAVSSRRVDTQSRRTKSPFSEFENAEPFTQVPAVEASKTDSAPIEPSARTSPHEPSLLQDLELDDEDGAYSDPEDADLFQQLAAEADEHARFAAELNHQSSVQTAADYEREFKALRSQQKKDRRDADEVTQIMIQECQQLLKLFGLPYITAPMEAEAQCAELVRLGLVDGIVTDDSDIFLFGGTRVYKNMFNQAKFVECYLASDLEKEFALDRDKLIRIAHLLGSDYTEGLPTIGPVTALEIVSEFDDLIAFRDWWGEVQTMNPALNPPKSEPTAFRKKFRKNTTRLFLPPAFPDARVDHAYWYPDVDSDTSAFVWGVPDLNALRAFLMATIGWTRERTDEVLVPVIRDMNRREREGTQSNITNYFAGAVGVGAAPSESGTGSYAPRRREVGKSKRMAGALGRLQEQAKRKRTGQRSPEGEIDAVVEEQEAENVTTKARENQPKKRMRASRSKATRK
ncbi:MAG: DNA repair protein rad2 [Vezdaea acicularis]|nr:MAG: DNA repair protein rad2 [Vezdaea acicularis]